MTQWFRDHWADDDVRRYFEVDDEGFVQRHVELEGPQREASTACSLQQWEDAHRTGTTEQYHQTYGTAREWSFASGDHDDPEPSTQAEFESAWE